MTVTSANRFLEGIKGNKPIRAQAPVVPDSQKMAIDMLTEFDIQASETINNPNQQGTLTDTKVWNLELLINKHTYSRDYTDYDFSSTTKAISSRVKAELIKAGYQVSFINTIALPVAITNQYDYTPKKVQEELSEFEEVLVPITNKGWFGNSIVKTKNYYQRVPKLKEPWELPEDVVFAKKDFYRTTINAIKLITTVEFKPAL